MERKILGWHAESIAIRRLKKNGLKILDKNFTCRCGEIDIIAKDKDEIVFVEVRSTVGVDFHDPAESFTASKIDRLHRLALIWLNKEGLIENRLRFDAMLIIFKCIPVRILGITPLSRYSIHEIRHLTGAF